jgi:regulatory protein
VRREAKRRGAAPGTDDAGSAYTRALRLLTVRSRGREELRRALIERGFAAAAASQALDRLESQGWLDDLGAARALVRSRSQRYGRVRIARELAARGFSKEIIESALSQAGSREEKALAGAFAKLWTASSGLPAEKRRRKVWTALLRRGFEAGAISAMIKSSGSNDDELERNP